MGWEILVILLTPKIFAARKDFLSTARVIKVAAKRS
jgi:hypothetical protein